jgi:hypothetical protein
MPVTLEIGCEEWTTLATVADAIGVGETRSVVRLRRNLEDPDFQTGLSFWFLDGPVVSASMLGWADWNGDLDVGVPVHLVRHAAVLAARAGSCSLVLADDGYQYLECPSGSSAVFDAPEGRLPAGTGNRSMKASATVQLDDLCAAIGSAMDMSRGGPGGQPPPSVSIGIEDGVVGVACDLRPFGQGMATFRIPASYTSGKKVVAASLDGVRDLFDGPLGYGAVVTIEICTRAVSFNTVKVPFDVDTMTFEVVNWGTGVLGANNRVMAQTPVMAAGAGRWTPQVIDALEDSGHYWGWAGLGVAMDSGSTGEEPEVRIEFCDTLPEILRLTRILFDNGDSLPKLHEAAGRLNAAKTEIRFWIDQGAVVASYDLPCARYPEVAYWADRLREETAGLGILVEASI